MSIEQQQELKPEKRTTKQGRKSIPFTDLSIKSWRPKKDKPNSLFNSFLVTLVYEKTFYILWTSS